LMIEELGEVIYVTNEQCLESDFLPSMDEQDSFCKAGDLIIIDEVWRIWGNDKDIPKNHRSFIAEHRHFADPITGVTCDLVVINQDISQIPRFIKEGLRQLTECKNTLVWGCVIVIGLMFFKERI
ncbi:TPA: hypothetical protein PXD88_002613, partial [Mannheimia haemolytica]|nr:hypothetical protein [Mannheimia haemolytica]